MTQLVYDGSFEGLLTAIFELYERKIGDACLVRSEHYQPQLIASSLQIIPDQKKAERVWNGLKQKLPVDKRNENIPMLFVRTSGDGRYTGLIYTPRV